MGANPLTAAIDEGMPLVVLSPHLDDAVLSCGALLAHASSRVPVTVATFFTEAGPPPYTLAARRHLRLLGFSDARQLYRARRAEDQAVLERLGAAWRHLGLTDGLFRRKPRSSAKGPRRRRLLTERDHIYPTYRLHLLSGRISAYDAGTLRQATEAIAALARERPVLLLAPSGVGGHVDHVLVRTAAERSRQPVVYYSDFPYNQQGGLDPDFARRNALSETTWQRDLTAKPALVRAYRTQVDALFPGGGIPLIPETYLVASTSPGASREEPR